MWMSDNRWEAATEALKPDASSGLGRAFALVFVEGPAAGTRVEFDDTSPSRVLIGQSPVCDARISDPTVSRRHVALEMDGAVVRLRDLDSRNGTYIGSVRVVEVQLRGGEMVRIGQSTFRLEPLAPRGAALPERTGFGAVVGASDAMRRLYRLCERLAHSEVPVVIEGETGTGKEQLARALHSAGRRREGRFVVFDCTAVSPNLIESELFGHERGAFTGSVQTRPGVFERADRGTLLIDEIGDLPLELQPKLLGILERGETTRVGGVRPIAVDVRVLAATRRDLDREVQAGRFRDDLFHRLAVTRIELPPLRARQGDVRLLAQHFCQELGAAPLPEALLANWQDYAWPGNVRELKNAVARRVALGDLADGPADTDQSSPPPEGSALVPREDQFARVLALELPLAEARQRIIDQFDGRYVQHMLDVHSGNVTRAAARAGVGRRHFQRMKSRLLGEED
jgi:DNA-binding NtrC family response regulator